MQTTDLNDSMMSDFYQVGGYTNFASSLVKRSSSSSILDKPLSNTGKKSTKGIAGIIYKRFVNLYNKIGQDYGLSDYEIDKLWAEFDAKKMGLDNFPAYVEEKTGKKNVLEAQIINEQNTIYDSPSVEVTDNSEPKENKMPYLWIGLGAVALVGVTILLVKK